MSLRSARIDYPDAIELARLHTPVQALPRLSAELDTEILCKRDDLTGSALSGNKVRKLEFLLAQALADRCDTVITCGGQQSNHARATAIAAARLGLDCSLLLRTADPNRPPEPTGNILLDQLAGATVQWISPEQYPERSALMQRRASQLARDSGKSCYVIPEGGSDALGAWGYVRCMAELAEQIGPKTATLVYAVGSGGTAAGLIAGCRLLDLPYRLIGVCVCDDRPTFQQRIAQILRQMDARYGLDVAVEPEGIEIWDSYVGRGYALSRPEEVHTLTQVIRQEGLVLDPVYTGKAFHGLMTEIRAGRRLGEPIIFIHTGGIYALFGMGDGVLTK